MKFVKAFSKENKDNGGGEAADEDEDEDVMDASSDEEDKIENGCNNLNLELQAQ